MTEGRKHALLSPSSAERWLTCTPSAVLESKFPDETSEFAEEGTLAHAICERLLNEDGIDDLTDNPAFTAEMLSHAKDYYEFVHGKFENLSTRQRLDAEVNVEVRLDISAFAPGCFGTSDAIIVAGNSLNVIDFKYGKSVKVDAVGNRQMMLYALGAIYMYQFMYDIDTVTMTIYQPRLENISEYTVSASDLMRWSEEYLRPRAIAASKGEGTFVAGSHCRFCRAKAQCRALAEENMRITDTVKEDPGLLESREVAEILGKAKGIKNWLTAVEEYALNSALDGKRFPGFKLVEGRSVRKYKDEEKVISALTGAGWKTSDITTVKLKGITEMEKLLTKKTFNALLSDLVIKPQGKPALVGVADKRPEFNSAENDFKDI